MNKLKELWQYPVFRWCVYQTPLLVFGLLLKYGAFDYYAGNVYSQGRPMSFWIGDVYTRDGGRHWKKGDIPYGFFSWDWTSGVVLIWVLILASPAVWVWRKPIWKLVKQSLGFLNKKAEEG